MAIGESVAKRLAYKAYSTGVISSGPPPALATDPGVTGGQTLRYQTVSGGLARTAFESTEKRPSRNIYSRRLGGRTAPFTINGEMSPKTYQDLLAAVMRGPWAAAVAKSNTEFTSIAFATGVGTVAASNWATQGYRVGDTVRFTGLSAAGNNAKNFMITAISGTAATFFPAPTDMGADTAFTVTTVGRIMRAPLTGHLKTAFAFEEYYEDLDIGDVHKQVRLGQFTLTMPAEGIATCTFTGIGRDTERQSAAGSPLFTAPAAVTTTNVLTTNGGNLLIAGVSQGLITSATLTVDIGVATEQAAFNQYPPEIFTNTLRATGSLTGFRESNVVPAYFDNETELEIALMLTDSTLDAAEFNSAFMPRVKLFDFAIQDSGRNGITWSANFEALEKATTVGYDSGPISFQDSQSA